MFGMGMPEILLILAIALIVLGPKKLPEIAKSLGRGIAEFKKATSDFKQSMAVDNDFKEAKETLHGIKTDVDQSVRDTMAQGAATVSDNDDDDDAAPEDDDAAPEKAAKHTSEKDTAPPQESAEDKSQQQAEQKAEQEEPSSNA
jgi:TatA/E family protein of Tat protein translocase